MGNKKTLFLGMAGLILLVGLSILLLPVGSSKTDALVWEEDYQEAFRKAQTRDQPVLVYLYTDWCGYCRRLEQTTFVDPSVIEAMSDRYVWLRLNAETDPEGERLRDRFSVRSYPTVLILDGDGEELDRVGGYVPPDRFGTMVDSLVSGPNSLQSLTRRVQEEPDSVEGHFNLAERYVRRGDYDKARTGFVRVIELDPANQQGKTDGSIFYLALSLASLGQTEFGLELLDALGKRFPESEYRPDSALLQGQILLREGRMEEAVRVLEAYLKAYPGHAFADRVEALLEQLEEPPTGR